MLNARANAEGALKFIDEAALDPYVFTRESFLQWRNFMINDGVTELEDDEFLDLEDDSMEDGSDASDSEPAGVSKSSETDAIDEAKPKGFNLKLMGADDGNSSLSPSSQQVTVQTQDQVAEPAVQKQ